MGTWRRKAMTSAVFAGAALLAVAAAACGGTSSSDKTATASAGRGNTPAAAATSAATKVATVAGTPAAGGAPSSGGLGVGSTSLGQVLVDGTKMTLYIFDKDTANNGKSACYTQCATNWPPAIVTSVPPMPSGATGAVATITRDDGTMQVTYNGMPLYRFAADKAPGDTKGDGVGGIWHVAKP